MTYSIGLAGKGGTGKTTLAGLLVKYLVEKGETPVLAVDADANANLNEVLGCELEETLGNAREEMKKGVSTGMTKDVYIEMKLQKAVIERPGFDLIVMGRPEGAGCYCAANSLLTVYLDKLINNYKFVVMDNEAGMEHLSRRTTQNIDELLLVSDHSVKGLRAVARIRELVSELKLAVTRESIIINLVPDGIDPLLKQEMDRLGITPAATVPVDEELQRYDLEQRPLFDLPDTSKAVKAVNDLMDKLLQPEKVKMKRG